MEEQTLKEKAAKIRLLVLDVDGTLTDGGVYIDENGVQSKKFNIRDGMGITILNEAGISVGMLSHSRASGILEKRAAMLNVKHVYAGKEPKLHVLHRWMLEHSLHASEVAYIGDDVNDLEIMAVVGLSACPADAHYHVIRAADIVLTRKGGEGCVREFIDRYLLPDTGL
jgi:3-deoxy-D-manno-octulosonate 8-phosphate phosphatase (KDO 8-P phosphatase)